MYHAREPRSCMILTCGISCKTHTLSALHFVEAEDGRFMDELNVYGHILMD